MSVTTQALCFLAGTNSIFSGDRLLTTGNAGGDADAALFAKLGLRASLAGPVDPSITLHPGLVPRLSCSDT